MAKFKPLAQGQTGSSVEQQMGIQSFDGDAGDITSREAGNMVKKMVKYAEVQLKGGQNI